MRSLSLVAVALGLVAALSETSAHASPIVTTFTATASNGPLAGESGSGSFTFDSSAIVFGGFNNAAGLLTDLTFTWNGILYDETTANTGGLGWDANGTLTNALFGTNCSAGMCIDLAGSNNWSIFIGAIGSLIYGVAGISPGLWNGTVIYSTPPGPGAPEPPPGPPLPEPSSLMLIGTGVAAAVATRWRLLSAFHWKVR